MADIEIDQRRLNASIYGAVVTLKLIDPTLVKSAQKTMKTAAEAIVQDARSRIPDVPTGTSPTGRPNWGSWGGSSDRSWSPGKVRRGIRSQFRAPRQNRPEQRPLISVVQSSPAGAVYDMAGKTGRYIKDARIGGSFVGAMRGSASRTMWPAAESKMSEVLAQMDAARIEMEKDINARLGSFGSGMAGF